MSKTTTTTKIRSDGTAVEVLVGGTERPFLEPSMRPMTEAEIEAAAGADPDAWPMTAEELRKARRVPRIRTLRRALGLTQDEFAGRYHFPVVAAVSISPGARGTGKAQDNPGVRLRRSARKGYLNLAGQEASRFQASRERTIAAAQHVPSWALCDISQNGLLRARPSRSLHNEVVRTTSGATSLMPLKRGTGRLQQPSRAGS
jgi:hypothetical protein